LPAIWKSSAKPLIEYQRNIRSKYSRIEWRKIIGLRNRIVHDYFSIDVEIVWEIVQKDLPVFKSKLSQIRDAKL
jgi:uncharacterized protein with HEPN domain